MFFIRRIGEVKMNVPESYRLTRIEETRRTLHRLTQDFDAWQTRRSGADLHKQYVSQLKALGIFLTAAVGEIEKDLKNVSSSQPDYEVYESCRSAELRLLWVRRIWEFFREKFDQRDLDSTAETLRAADEVVWSCYQEIFRNASVDVPECDPGPAPLPFIESRFSPEAMPKDLVPQDLRRDVDLTFLKEYLEELPIPLVRLPPTCVDSPWCLVLLGHELGHHVHARLLPQRQLVTDFAAGVGAAAGTKGEEAKNRWGTWSHEIFADLYSVLMMGPWAACAMLELELSKPTSMLVRRGAYPQAAVRLQLMTDWITTLGMPGTLYGSYDFRAMVQGNPEAEEDMGLVQAVVAAAANFFIAGQPLHVRSGFRSVYYTQYGAVEEWEGKLAAGGDPAPWKVIQAPRVLTSASMAVWHEIRTAQQPDPKRLETLRRSALKLIALNREEGSRAEQSVPDTHKLGARLGERLCQSDVNELYALATA
jgi:hypothetical protein